MKGRKRIIIIFHTYFHIYVVVVSGRPDKYEEKFIKLLFLDTLHFSLVYDKNVDLKKKIIIYETCIYTMHVHT